jgi:hypothetical protein
MKKHLFIILLVFAMPLLGSAQLSSVGSTPASENPTGNAAQNSHQKDFNAHVKISEDGKLSVNILNAGTEAIHYKFMNYRGVVLEQSNFRTESGIHIINKDIQTWPTGVYLLELKTGSQTKLLRFVNY